MKLDFKIKEQTHDRHEGAIRMLRKHDLLQSDRRSFNFSLVVSCKISSFANELNFCIPVTVRMAIKLECY